MRFLKAEDSRIPKQACQMMISMNESEQKCWVTEVKNVLRKNFLFFYCVYLQQGVEDEKIILSELKQSLSDIIHEWNVTIKDKDRYFPYYSIKSIFELAQ